MAKVMSEIVREAAQDVGIRALAREASVEPMTVSRFMKGGRCRSDQLDKMAEVLGIEARIIKSKADQ